MMNETEPVNNTSSIHVILAYKNSLNLLSLSNSRNFFNELVLTEMQRIKSLLPKGLIEKIAFAALIGIGTDKVQKV